MKNVFPSTLLWLNSKRFFIPLISPPFWFISPVADPGEAPPHFRPNKLLFGKTSPPPLPPVTVPPSLFQGLESPPKTPYEVV